MTTPTNTRTKSAILVIFGITGDLSQRYLLPALTEMIETAQVGPKTHVIGITRRDVSVDDLFDQLAARPASSNDDSSRNKYEKLKAITSMITMDLTDEAAYLDLHKKINSIESEAKECMQTIFYLSIPPEAYSDIAQCIGNTGLNTACEHGNQPLLLVEKPFGQDYNSASTLLDSTAKVFAEEQTFRIDHFLAKTGVQDFIEFRREYSDQLAHFWTGEQITKVEIIASEKIDIEGRAKFYEPLGALKDFVQNHLLQVLGIFGADLTVSNGKARFLETINPVDLAQTHNAIRGQYQGYKDEVNNPDSDTETFALVKLTSKDARWQNTKFVLWSGKAMDKKEYSVTISLISGEQLIYRIQPDQAVIVQGDGQFTGDLQAMADEYNLKLRNITESGNDNAYVRVISHALALDHSIFAGREEILQSWRILDPVVKDWTMNAEGLIIYKKGQVGPIK